MAWFICTGGASDADGTIIFRQFKGILEVGESSISFSDPFIDDNKVCEVYTKDGRSIQSIECDEHVCTITFPTAVEEELEVLLRVTLPTDVIASGGDVEIDLSNYATNSELSPIKDKTDKWSDYISGTISAGETEIVLTDESIHTDSTIDVYFEDKVLAPESVVFAEGSLTLTIPEEETDTNVKVRVW